MLTLCDPVLAIITPSSATPLLMERLDDFEVAVKGQLMALYKVPVQSFGSDLIKACEHEQAQAARTAFQTAGALLSLFRSSPRLN